MLEGSFRLQVRMIGKYLAHWGITLQKRIKKPYEQRPEVVQHQECPAVAQRARREGVEIHWGGETALG